MTDNHPATPEPQPDNVVALTDKIMADGPTSAEELARKRAIVMRAFEISAHQLQADAEEFEKSAKLGEHHIKRFHELTRTAEAFRVSSGWLLSLAQPAAPPKEEQPA